MASKRQLKKDINNLTYDLVTECFTYRHFHPDLSAGLNDIIQEIVVGRNQLITKVNNIPSDVKDFRAYFSAVHEGMQGMINQLDKIGTLK